MTQKLSIPALRMARIADECSAGAACTAQTCVKGMPGRAGEVAA